MMRLDKNFGQGTVGRPLFFENKTSLFMLCFMTKTLHFALRGTVRARQKEGKGNAN